MEPKNVALEDDFPSYLGDFLVSCSFSRVYRELYLSVSTCILVVDCRIIHLLYNAVRIRVAISSIAVNSNLHLKWSPGLVFNTQTDWKQARIYISI